MANTDSTASDKAATENSLEKQFPISGDAFAVWYCNEEGAKWAINDDEGEAIAMAANHEDAVKIANGFRAGAYEDAIKKANALKFSAKGNSQHADETSGLKLASKLYRISAALSGFEPILDRITDTTNLGDNSYEVCCSLSVIGGMAARLNGEICAIADEVYKLEKAA